MEDASALDEIAFQLIESRFRGKFFVSADTNLQGENIEDGDCSNMQNIQTPKSTSLTHAHSNKLSITRNQELLQELDILRAVGCTAHRSRRRFAMRKYLRAVLRTYRRWDKNTDPYQNTRRAAAICGVTIRHGTHPLKLLIDLTTSEPDPKVRSRWGRALELAEREGVKASELFRYLRTVRGIAGAARKMALAYGRGGRGDDWGWIR